MARIRKANKNSNMMVVRAYEAAASITITAGEGNDDFEKAWIAETADGDPVESATVGATVYLVVAAGEEGTASVHDTDSEQVAVQAGEGNTTFEVPDSDLTINYVGGK